MTNSCLMMVDKEIDEMREKNKNPLSHLEV